MLVNFGGFVPISTVDWPGRAVCTVFLRGCPVRCDYCHNKDLQNGEDLRPIEDILDMIRSSRIAVSGVVFSGGEPTLQGEALQRLAESSTNLGLHVGIHTNGVYPEAVRNLIDGLSVYRVALDIKARWTRYDNLLQERFSGAVKETLAACTAAYLDGRLLEFQVVVTLFRGYEDEVGYISREAQDVPLVLQQGIHGQVQPLSLQELKMIGDKLGRPVIIRTREDGELYYEGTWTGRAPGKRQG